ncbi:MAG: hypothetical protein CW346_16690 [Bacillaceae bacterium]|nr:hypothetical protein [Bacillaceae bacterium]
MRIKGVPALFGQKENGFWTKGICPDASSSRFSGNLTAAPKKKGQLAVFCAPQTAFRENNEERSGKMRLIRRIGFSLLAFFLLAACNNLDRSPVGKNNSGDDDGIGNTRNVNDPNRNDGNILDDDRNNDGIRDNVNYPKEGGGERVKDKIPNGYRPGVEDPGVPKKGNLRINSNTPRKDVIDEYNDRNNQKQ